MYRQQHAEAGIKRRRQHVEAAIRGLWQHAEAAIKKSQQHVAAVINNTAGFRNLIFRNSREMDGLIPCFSGVFLKIIMNL